MAGETVSLDYRPLATDEEKQSGYHTDPVAALYLPGYQLVHSFERWGADCWQVRRVTRRINQREAQNGIEEETYLYPDHYATEAAAEAAAQALYARDGAGDVGSERDPLAQQVSQAQAQAAALAQQAAARSAAGPQIGTTASYGG